MSSYRRAFIDHKGPSKGDFLFGESEFEPVTMEYTSSYMHNMINNDNDWTLSKEAFPLRHEIKDRSPPPEQFPNHPPDINEDCASLMIEDQPSQLIVSNIPKPQFWDPTNLIEEALKHHAALRDIQTSASILIALGEKRKNLNIETAVQEHWILEYLDMLAKFKLWNVATQVSDKLLLNNLNEKHSNVQCVLTDYSIGLDSVCISIKSTINCNTRMLSNLYKTIATSGMVL